MLMWPAHAALAPVAVLTSIMATNVTAGVTTSLVVQVETEADMRYDSCKGTAQCLQSQRVSSL